jgi:hypothetical protein
MPRKRIVSTGIGALFLLCVGYVASRAQDQESPVADPVCTFFGAKHDQFVPALNRRPVGKLTEEVVSRLAVTGDAVIASMPSAPGGSRTDAMAHADGGTIDRYIFQALSAANIAPAPATNDFEFIRRATLDLTGRIPAAEAVIGFVNDTAADKRAKLVDTLLASPTWVDKWTVWFSDLYKNNSRNTQIPRYVPGHGVQRLPALLAHQQQTI